MMAFIVSIRMVIKLTGEPVPARRLSSREDTAVAAFRYL
jgi:hypothetical protein